MRRIAAFHVLFAGLLWTLAPQTRAQVPGNIAPAAPESTPAAPPDQPTGAIPPTSTASPPTPPLAASVDISGSDSWIDTKVELRAQDEVTITATGTLVLPAANAKSSSPKISPAGASRGFRDLLKSYPVNQAGQGALIGRVGDQATAPAFLIGPSLKWRAPRAGKLFVGINKSGNDKPTGTFHVTIAVAARAPESLTQVEYKLADITTEMIDRVPRRITDAQGNVGDNTNFVIVGNEKQILDALKTAGWVEVDRSHGDAITNGIEAVLNRQAYLTIPMSELMLFGRVQDHGMAHAEPIAVVAQRHHFRIWKAPFQATGPGGTSDVWVGAGTHDIGFDRDQRNNGITHKIDPDVDQEREFIGMSIQESGQVAKLSYVMPSQPSKEALTATGASFHSDGRVLVIHMIPQSAHLQTPVSPFGAPVAPGSSPNPNNPQQNNPPSIFDGAVQNR